MDIRDDVTRHVIRGTSTEIPAFGPGRTSEPILKLTIWLLWHRHLSSLSRPHVCKNHSRACALEAKSNHDSGWLGMRHESTKNWPGNLVKFGQETLETLSALRPFCPWTVQATLTAYLAFPASKHCTSPGPEFRIIVLPCLTPLNCKFYNQYQYNSVQSV